MTKEAQAQTVEKELQTYKEQKANILGPTTSMEGLSEFHKVIVDSVRLSPNPADGDVYKHKDEFGDKPAQFILSGQALQRLAICAGVFWNSAETKATAQSQKYVAYSAVGCIRKTDGTPACFKAEADIDIDVEGDELREKFIEKRKGWAAKPWFKKMDTTAQDDYIDGKFRKELNFKKKHKTKIAASSAKNRVIRVLLGIKKTYTQQELSKPFVMPRIVLQPDYNDPEVKRMMLTASIQAMTGIYGGAPPVPMSAEIDIQEEDYSVQSVPPKDSGNAEPPFPLATDDQPEPPNTPPATDDNKEPSKQEVFEDLSASGQVETLKQLCGLKGYEPKQPVDNLAAKDRLSFWLALGKLRDIETTTVEGDIPY
ncbi:MAG: hypothetical protein KAS66_10630 [Candidatus Omnitrophica bacterium]|nr:hypothetical protein [Candidatus Omnitrophota bacterium]